LRTIKLCMLGFGNVGRRFCELVATKEVELADEFGLRVLFSAVGTAGHGSLLTPEGLTAGEVLVRAGTNGSHDHTPAHSPGLRFPGNARPAGDLIASSHADVLIEATPLDPHGGLGAIAHIEAGFAHGMDVVTVNKGPISWDYRRLADLAAESGRRLRFEGTVMDGAPVFNLFETCLRGCKLLGFDAVFNSTTNFILDAMGEGVGFAEALAHVQSEGYAEADPAHDIEGHDAAAKTAALANVLMDARMTPDDIPKESIREVSAARVREVIARGNRLRVVCTALPGDLVQVGATKSPKVCAVVKVVELSPVHPLYSVGGSSLSVILHTDLMGDLEIAERNGLPDQTAYAVYSDLLTLYVAR